MSATAGDKFVDFVLDQIHRARKRLPIITNAAERSAERIVRQNGEYLAAGDDGFAGEPVWRAGGIAFLKRYRPDKQVQPTASAAASERGTLYSDEFMGIQRTANYEGIFNCRDAHGNDVVLLGYENERQEQNFLASYLQQLLSNEALVLLFASESTAHEVESRFGKRENVLPIVHDVADGGILEVPGWPAKICSGRSFVQRLHLWVFQAELIGAFLRRGRIPSVLLSITYESPQFFNLPLIHSYRFIPAFDVTPVSEGELGGTYLDHIQKIASTVFSDQAEQFRRSAQWLASALRNDHKVFLLITHGVIPVGLGGNADVFRFYRDPNLYYPELEKTFAKEDVALYIGYNWYPSELPAAVEKAGGRVILSLTLVRDLPPRAVIYGPGGPLFHPTSLHQLPQRENWIYIDAKFAQYDGTLKIPGYPVPAACTSDLTCNMLYWRFLADTVELLAA
jgi:hypothetical protein